MGKGESGKIPRNGVGGTRETRGHVKKHLDTDDNNGTHSDRKRKDLEENTQRLKCSQAEKKFKCLLSLDSDSDTGSEGDLKEDDITLDEDAKSQVEHANKDDADQNNDHEIASSRTHLATTRSKCPEEVKLTKCRTELIADGMIISVNPPTSAISSDTVGRKLCMRVPKFADPELTKLAETKVAEVANAMETCVAKTIEAVASFVTDEFSDTQPENYGDNEVRRQSLLRIPKFANPELTRLAQKKVAEVTSAMKACISQAIEASTALLPNADTDCNGADT